MTKEEIFMRQWGGREEEEKSGKDWVTLSH